MVLRYSRLGRYSIAKGTGLCALAAMLCAALLSGLLFSQPAAAAGLGEMELMSSFNEPLQVKIPIDIDPSEAEAGAVKYGVATAKEFKRMGIRWTYELATLKVEYVEEGDQQYLLLKSRDRFREPLLSLVVYLETIRGGRILRTYAVPMDIERDS